MLWVIYFATFFVVNQFPGFSVIFRAHEPQEQVLITDMPFTLAKVARTF